MGDVDGYKKLARPRLRLRRGGAAQRGTAEGGAPELDQLPCEVRILEKEQVRAGHLLVEEVLVPEARAQGRL